MTETALHAPSVGAIRRPVLITGGAGFIGANLADRLAADGHDVLVYDSLARSGTEVNLAWLKSRHPRSLASVIADVRDKGSLAAAARESRAVFHLAAQVAVTTSLENPELDFEVNAGGTITLLEALRRGNRAPLLFASTNKVYGALPDIKMDAAPTAHGPRDPRLRASGIDESRPLDFHTPYGCSKGAADQYVLDYARAFGVPTVVFRMSCVYGERQRGTEDQGWVAHFLLRALQGSPITIFGDGRQVRDLLHVGDAVAAYLAAWEKIDRVTGRAFNLGGGPDNAASLLDVLAEIERLLGHRVEHSFEAWRPGDQRWYVSDARAARAALGLSAPLAWREGLARLFGWMRSESGTAALSEAVA